MRGTVPGANGRTRLKTAGWIVAVLVMAAPFGVRAQTVVSDPGTHDLLASILSELQTQTGIMNEQTDRLNEIKALDEDILDAICGRSTIGTRIAAAEDLDLTNAGVTVLGLMQGDLPGDVATPNPADVDAIQRSAEELFGMARQVVDLARDVERLTSNGSIEARLKRIALPNLRVIRRMRENALIEAIQGSYAFSTYSLNQGATAKGREVSMNQVRRSADCLREDVNALNQSTLEVLSRLNHVGTLLGYRTALDSATALQGIPVLTEPLEDADQ